MAKELVSILKKMGEQILTIKKPPLPQGKVVKANFSMTKQGFDALEAIEKWKGCQTHGEAFHIIYSWASKLVPMLKDLNLIKDTPTEIKIRRTFGINEYALAGFNKLAKKYDLSVESIIETSVRFMAGTLTLFKAKPFKNKREALEAIDDAWKRIGELRLRLNKTFLEQGEDSNDPGDPAYHFVTIDAGMDGLYFSVEEMYNEIEKRMSNEVNQA
jgi:hypothetical protein